MNARDFSRLTKRDNGYFINNRRPFEPLFQFDESTIRKAYEFAFGMTFGEDGEHRRYRSGGQHSRKKGEVFINTFQGKLSEFGIYEFLTERGIEVDEPDTSQWELGKWDSTDLEICDKKINIKSTKFFGNLLLLETKDWDTEGEYIPNLESGDSHYDFFILTRINPSGEQIMKKNKIMYSDRIPIGLNLLEEIMENGPWEFDIAGIITHEDLVHIINSDFILPQNSYLSGRVPMDAENYYLQSGDMRNPGELIDLLRG